MSYLDVATQIDIMNQSVILTRLLHKHFRAKHLTAEVWTVLEFFRHGLMC